MLQLATPPIALSVEALDERLPVLVATRTPRDCKPSDAPTLVNHVRSFVGCVLGLDIPQIDDRVYAVPDLGSKDEVIRVPIPPISISQ
jgi:hypothetical protein